MAGALTFLMFIPEPSAQKQPTDARGTSQATIADSVSRFYTEFRAVSRDPIKDRYGDYTILLDEQNKSSIDKLVEGTTSKRFGPLENPEGKIKQRSFPQNSTIMQEAMAHASKEGFILVWDLHQDFIIRNRFNSHNSFAGMLEELAGAVDSNFNKPINIYFCEKKRTYIITVRESTYLNVHCQKSFGDDQYY